MVPGRKIIFALFTDVSVNPQRHMGVGACLLVPVSFLDRDPQQVERTEVFAKLRFRRFEETSSTKLEVQTVLWALGEYRAEFGSVDPGTLRVYTDSQCVAGLLGRRAGLEGTSYIARRSAHALRNATLYRAFFAAHDDIGFTLFKVAGHARARSHTTVQRVFAHVDQGVRRELSGWLIESGTLNE
ncbi:MAG: ribonuclease H [Desulfuromonadales bacterium]|nr:ribonuclease H [Desulfuromonadales bacterium]